MREIKLPDRGITLVIKETFFYLCDECPWINIGSKILGNLLCEKCMGECGYNEYPVDILDQEGNSILLRYVRPIKK